MTIELIIIVYKLRGDILLLSNDILKIVHIISDNHFETCSNVHQPLVLMLNTAATWHELYMIL